MTSAAITIDGRKVSVRERTPLLAVCRENGIDIPTLCFMDGMEAYGACRLCTVGLERPGWVKFVTACNFPVENGQVFETASARVLALRRLIVESLLARCPDVEILQDLARRLGVNGTRFVKRPNPDRCILCGLCVKVCSDVVGANAIGFVGRGIDRTVGTPFGVLPDSCIGCGACSAVCPTAAIDMESRAVERFRESPGSERWCRYARMGLTPGALCPSSYDCARCEIDQYFVENQPPHPVFGRRAGAAVPGDAVQGAAGAGPDQETP